MPKEISIEELESLLPRTLEVFAKRSGEYVKFKLRTKKTLFTLKVDVEENNRVESIISSNSSLSINELG